MQGSAGNLIAYFVDSPPCDQCQPCPQLSDRIVDYNKARETEFVSISGDHHRTSPGNQSDTVDDLTDNVRVDLRCSIHRANAVQIDLAAGFWGKAAELPAFGPFWEIISAIQQQNRKEARGRHVMDVHI